MATQPAASFLTAFAHATIQTIICPNPAELAQPPHLSLAEDGDAAQDAWVSRLMSYPSRSSAFSDEVLHIYITLIIDLSATDCLPHEGLPGPSRAAVQEFFRATLSLQFEARYQLPQAPIASPPRPEPAVRSPHAASAGTRHEASPTPRQSKSMPSPSIANKLGQPPLYPFDHDRPNGLLFTAVYPPQPRSDGPQLSKNDQLAPVMPVQAEGSMRLGKVENQWVLVWLVQGRIAPVNALGANSVALSLSSLVSNHHESCAPRPHLVSSTTEPARDAYCEEDFHTIDLLEGLGLDAPLPSSCLATKPDGQPGNLARPSRYHQSLTSSARGTSNSLPSITSPPLFSSPPKLEPNQVGHDRRSSAPVLPPKDEPAAGSPRTLDTEKRHVTVVSVIDPLSINVFTAVVRHDVRPARALPPSQHPSRFEKQPEGNFMILLAVGNVTGEPAAGQAREGSLDFILEDVKISVRRSLEEVGEGSESIRIALCSSSNDPVSFRTRIGESGVHSLIYSARPNLSDVECFNGTNKICIPPSTPISDVTVAFRHQRRGIPLVHHGEEIGNDTMPSAISVMDSPGDSDREGPSTVWLGPKQHHHTPRSRATSPVNGRFQHQHPRRRGSAKYLLEVEIKGQLVRTASTGDAPGFGATIVSSWKAVMEPHACLTPRKVTCYRQGVYQSISPDNLRPELGSAEHFEDQLRKPPLVSPARPFRQQSLVGGSRRHTATQLAGALSTLSSFQQYISPHYPEPDEARGSSLGPDTDLLWPRKQSRSNRRPQHLAISSSVLSTPLSSPSIASFSRRLIHSISPSSTPSWPGSGLNSNATETVRMGSEATRTNTLNSKLDVMSNADQLGRSGMRLDGSGQLIVSLRLVMEEEDKQEEKSHVSVGEVFLVEILIINRLARSVRLEVWLEEGKLENLVALDDGMTIGSVSLLCICVVVAHCDFVTYRPLMNGECGSVRMRCMGVREGIFPISMVRLVERKQGRRKEVKLLNPLVIAVVA